MSYLYEVKYFLFFLFFIMTIKLLIIGASNYETIDLPAWATVEQLALMKNLTGEFKKVWWAVLQSTDLLNDNDLLSFSAGTTRTVTNVDGSTTVVVTSKKISWAAEGLINVRFVKTVVEKELPLPEGITVKEALDLAGIRRGNISINGTPVGFWALLNSDTTIELSIPASTQTNNCEQSDDCDEDEEDDYDF